MFTFFVAIVSIMFIPMFAIVVVIIMAVSATRIENHVQMFVSSEVEELILAQQELIVSLTELVQEYETRGEIVMAELHSMHEVINVLLKNKEVQNIKPMYGPFDVPHPANMRTPTQGEYHA